MCGIASGSGYRRVALTVLLGRRGDLEHANKADDLRGGVEEHPESVRLPAYPMPEDLCRSVALVPPHDVDQQIVVLGRRRSRWRLPKCVPLKQRTHDRVIA